MDDSQQFAFRVTDLKQYAYCPRILYYHTVLPLIRPVTYKMEAGISAHTLTERKERRRSLRPYGIEHGKRAFNLQLTSLALRLSGELDMLITTETELIPVDYKSTARDGPHFRLQLMAYGRLLEATHPESRLAVRRGFLYLIPERSAVEVRFTQRLRNRLK
ncbi:MAG: CRISPR-associated protein Cas4, partial [Chloroflexota bacterium]